MMIIAVIIGAMLMPAQVSAQSSREKRGDKRVQVDSKRGGGKSDKNFGKGDKGKNDKRGGFVGKGNNKFNKHGHNHKPKVVHHHHKPKVVVKHCHHSHRPKVVHHHHSCNGDVVGAAAAVIGTVALISLLAD